LGFALGAATAAALAPLLNTSSFRRITTADAWAKKGHGGVTALSMPNTPSTAGGQTGQVIGIG
jgi:hypothetical protein